MTADHTPPTPDDAGPPGGVSIAPGVVVPEAALRFAFSRSSGPGGQNVNKRSTQAELRIALADIPIPNHAKARLRRLLGSRLVGEEGAEEILLTSDAERSQRQNRDACLDRLRDLLVRAMARPKPRIATRPTKGAQKRRRQAREQHSQKKSRRRWKPGE
jgi:ribosome-associated protein